MSNESLELNRIYQMDCLEGMKLIKDKSIDMILCDLPYGTTAQKWDVVIPFEPLWEQYERIIKDNGAIVLTCKQPFTSDLLNSNRKLFRYELIWEKTRASNNMQLKKQFAQIHENILVFYKKQPTYNDLKFKVDDKYIDKRKNIRDSYYNSGHYNQPMKRKADDGWRHPQSILPFNSVWHKGMHPTQKPDDLFQYLIETYTNEGDVVLDNCIGSGTTAIACININRNFIGFEIEQEYTDNANERINSLNKNI